MPEIVTTSSNVWLAGLESADPVVMAVLYLLVFLSLLTWFLIAYKAAELWWAKRTNQRYSKRFWDSTDLAQLHNIGSGAPAPKGPLAQLTASGIMALGHYQTHHTGPTGVIDNLTEILTRALRQCIQDQMTHYERGLGILATIGNTAPFIGLFGTVVGIMSALKGIAEIGSADLSVVAGPIGEALIATAAGIGCAIPAVVGYNSFVRRMKVFGNTLDSFAYDLLARLTTEQALRDIAHKSKSRVEV